MTEEDRDMGESETLGMYTDKKMAIQIAENAFNRQDYASVEVLKLTQTGDEDDEVIFFLESGYSEEGEEYKLGGMFGKSRYNTGRSWHLDHARHNKKEDYEKPINERKGAKKVSSASKSATKRAKTGKYAKASRSSASASSSKRGYNYIPNSQIKSITTVDDKVITKKKILDGAYVRKKNGGMM
jgi:ribosomal protein L18E